MTSAPDYAATVTVLRRRRDFRAALDNLRAAGYRVALLDAAGWQDAAGMHRALAAGLGFPAYYGANLDALADCLRDVATGAYGWSPGSDAGIALALENYAAFGRVDRALAAAVLDAMAAAARFANQVGHRLAVVVHSGTA